MNWKEYPQNIRVRLFTSFFNRAVSSAVMPFIALFFAHEKNKIWAGLFLILTVIVSFVVSLIGGYLTDRFKRKKILILTSLVSTLMFLCMTLSLFPEKKIIWLFSLAYIGFVVASSLGRPAMQAIIMDSTTPENRKSIYTVDYWLMNLSMAIGAALGGLLYQNFQKELFLLLTIVSFTIPVIYKFWLLDDFSSLLVKKHQNLFLDIIHNYQIAIKDKNFVKVVIGTTLIFAAEFSLNSYIGIRLSESFKAVLINDFKIDGVRMLSILNIQNMFLVVCFTFITNKLIERFSSKKTLLFGLLLYGIGYVTVTSANTLFVLLVFNFIAAIGELIYSPVKNAEQANMIPADKRGSYSAFAGLSFGGADLIASSAVIVGAFLMPTMMSVYIGVIILLGTLLLYTGIFIGTKIESNNEIEKISS